MNEQDLQRYKKKLLDLRERSRDEINRMIEVVITDAEAVGEHDRKVSESVGKEISLQHTEETLRNEVLAALRRIDDGTFGQCLECGGAIPKTRLNALPFTPHCVRCERQIEG